MQNLKEHINFNELLNNYRVLKLRNDIASTIEGKLEYGEVPCRPEMLEK